MPDLWAQHARLLRPSRLRRVAVRVVALAMALSACAPSAAPVATATVPPTSTLDVTAPPTGVPAPAAMLPEAAGWSKVMSATQSSIARPTSLPASIDRTTVEVRDLVAAPFEPRYTVVYRTPRGEAIVFALGPVDMIAGSGIGTVVRGQDATLTFPSTLFTDPSRPGTRRVRWTEFGAVVLSISSDRFTGDDLLRVAWNLDPVTAPPPKTAFSRTVGACGAAAPEDSTRLFVSLLGRHRPEAIADCFSSEFLGRAGMAPMTGWADLPAATLDSVGSAGTIGGRSVIQVTWTFASDPGGPWTRKPTMFFTFGLDQDRWRIYELGTGAVGRAP